MRARTNITLKERSSLHFEFNKGVDLSSAPQNVALGRASYMKNMILENGVLRKRHGWNALYNFDAEINGIFDYRYQQHQATLVHAGNKIYRISNDGSHIDITGNLALKSSRSQAFFNRGRLYIVGCGDYLAYGSWDNGATYELRSVIDDEDTYIPTTTVNINCTSSGGDIRATLDSPNLLCKKRKNQLVGVSTATATTNVYWTLDSEIDIGSNIEVIIERAEKVEGETIIATYKLTNSGWDTIINQAYLMESTSGKAWGYCTTNQLMLNVDTTPPLESKGNITVTFEHPTEGYAERIKNCSFGTLFGVDGNNDRLFLSGNEEYSNYDFFSQDNDFSYFPDLNYSVMGSDDVPVKGFSRLSDSTLVVHKEATDREATVYFRTGEYEKQIDEDTGLEVYTESFKMKAGAIGEGLASTYTTTNFAGDPIMLSRNGVFGIVLSNNVATTERYARERSRLINKELCTHDLSNAVGIAYKGRYYLSVDEVCYVADARYKTQVSDDIDGSFNYEWWYWTNIPARVWAIIGGTLYFGSEDGQVCCFDDEYTDRGYFYTAEGQLSIESIEFNDIDDDIAYDNDLLDLVESGSKVRLSANIPLYSKIGTQANGCVNGDISTINLGEIVYFDNSADLLPDIGYVVTYINYADNAIEINDGLATIDKGAGIYRKISDKDLYIHISKEENTFCLSESPLGENIRFAKYNNQMPTTLLGRFALARPIEAQWHSPLFDMGTNVYSKTLLKTTLSAMNVQGGKLMFGYETRSNRLITDANGFNSQGLHYFSLDNFALDEFSFEKDFIKSYTRKCNERNFNYIRFYFKESGNADCGLYDFTATYKLNKANKGVK